MAEDCSASVAEGRRIVILLWVGRLDLMIKESLNSGRTPGIPADSEIHPSRTQVASHSAALAKGTETTGRP